MHVCLFDIDGTLILTGGAGMASLKAALRSAFGVADPTESVPLEGRTDRGIVGDLFRHHQIDATEENWERFRAAYLHHLPACLAERKGRVLPGIVELLELLSTRDDITLGLLTGNTRAGAKAKLIHYKLDRFFDFDTFGGFGDLHISRDDVAREALASVHTRLNGNVHLDRVWVIGDTPSDVRCARAIGAKAIGVATGGHTAEELSRELPDHLLPDFSDHERVLPLWVSGCEADQAQNSPGRGE